MEIELPSTKDKTAVVNVVQQYLEGLNFRIIEADLEKPWGAYFVIEGSLTQQFISNYFPDYSLEKIQKYGSQLQPKILLVAPGKQLSWQYHNRRAELWRVINGPVAVTQNDTDDLVKPVQHDSGTIIQFGAHQRHRLAGLNHWGVVAEIWQHTNPNNPSDESDIVRVADDFGR